eukprot:8360902-Alexandrium_andersonii.AAC.1
MEAPEERSSGGSWVLPSGTSPHRPPRAEGPLRLGLPSGGAPLNDPWGSSTRTGVATAARRTMEP